MAVTQLACKCGGRASTLLEAADEGCKDCASKFISEAGRAVNGTTALIRAAEKGHLEIVKLLIPLEAKMLNQYDWTALMLSAVNGHLEVAKLLIPHEAKMQNNDGTTALIESARKGHLEIVKLLIPHEAKMQNKQGQTALMFSAGNGHLEVVKLLAPLEAKMQDNDDQTALIWTFNFYELEAAKLLLPYESNIVDKNGKTPAEYARFKSPEIRALFAAPAPAASPPKPQQPVLASPKPQNGPTPEPPKPACKCGGRASTLLEAADEGCKDCASKFISEAGRAVNGTTALIRAAEKGHLEIVKLLVAKEAMMKDSGGQTALHKAAAGGNLQVVRLLMMWEVEGQDAEGRTSLMHAIRAGHGQVAKTLLKLEGGIADNKGKKPGDFASSASSAEIWALFPEDVNNLATLLEQAHGSECACPLKAQNLRAAAIAGCLKCTASHLFETGTFTHNKTALMIAAIQDHPEVVELLALKEAGLASADGKTALMHAAEARSPGAVEALIPYEAGLQDAEGKTALAYAIQSGCAEAVRLLLPHEENIADKNKASRIHDGYELPQGQGALPE